jgi:hypothetical protein
MVTWFFALLSNASTLAAEARGRANAVAVEAERSATGGGEAALGSLDLAYADLSDTRRAIEAHEQYLATVCELDDRRGEGAVLGT